MPGNDGTQYTAWERTQAYIHWHEENARRAAGGLTAQAIRQKALSDTKIATIARFNATVYSGTTSMQDLQSFDNAIGNINSAVADSAQVQSIILDAINQTLNFRGSGLSAQQVVSKISNLIGGTKSMSKGNFTKELDEVLTILYDKDLHSLIQSLSKQKNLSTIKLDQLESLRQVENMIKNNNWSRDKTAVRNTLVDILTEQGLPDFLQECSKVIEPYVNGQFIEEAFQFGKVRIQNSSRQGKIDTMATFNLPGGRQIKQGISLKNNWAGYYASILTTTLRASLNYGHQGNQYAMSNAISLMTVEELKAWMEWTNLDRALQGTMTALENGMQDRADLLIEFTTNGLQVHNINWIMMKLLERIKSMGNARLSMMGFGMSERYGQSIVAYDRSKFAGPDIQDMIEKRSGYTKNWLGQSHAIVLDANKLVQALTR